MRVTLLANGNLRLLDQTGTVAEVSPEHPDYTGLCSQYRSSITPRTAPVRLGLGGIIAFLVGLGAWWYHYHW
jgi:hypothetical protein